MAAAKKPGKLKFNPAMFNMAGMKPGAKNPKLEALKRKREQESTGQLLPADSKFARPPVTKRRRAKTRKLVFDEHSDNISQYKPPDSFAYERKTENTAAIPSYEQKTEYNAVAALPSSPGVSLTRAAMDSAPDVDVDVDDITENQNKQSSLTVKDNGIAQQEVLESSEIRASFIVSEDPTPQQPVVVSKEEKSLASSVSCELVNRAADRVVVRCYRSLDKLMQFKPCVKGAKGVQVSGYVDSSVAALDVDVIGWQLAAINGRNLELRSFEELLDDIHGDVHARLAAGKAYELALEKPVADQPGGPGLPKAKSIEQAARRDSVFAGGKRSHRRTESDLIEAQRDREAQMQGEPGGFWCQLQWHKLCF